jgi:hypothetical protein
MTITGFHNPVIVFLSRSFPHFPLLSALSFHKKDKNFTLALSRIVLCANQKAQFND